MLIITRRVTMLIGLSSLVLSCSKEVPPRSVSEFVDNPMLLEATMVRCAANRSQTKYDPECVNARDATNRLASIEEQARRHELEAQSEQKRQALRRTQEAAAEARRRAAEAQRLREEAAYLEQFNSPATTGTAPAPGNNSPGQPAPAQPNDRPAAQVPPPPAGEPEATPSPDASDLEAIREELKRRQDESQ
jgi:hypothetical protein